MLTVALWNLASRTETSASGRAALAILDQFTPDILCDVLPVFLPVISLVRR